MRSRDEIEEQLNLTVEPIDEGRSQWPGMTYEQGVAAALQWVVGEINDKPMVDE